MIRDITIGQYYAGDSLLHRMDARMKLMLTLACMIIIFLCQNFFSLGLLVLATIVLAVLSRVPAGMLLRSLRPIAFLVVFTSVLNIFYTTGADTHILVQIPLHFRGWVLTITQEGVFSAVFTAVRILCLILISSLLTYTTTSSMLTTGLERLLSPLAKLHVPVTIFATMMSLALRFVPTLIEETDRIMNAQKSRGSNLETGSLFQRVRAFVPVLIPLIISAFRRAAELANAMESRCFTGSNECTKMKRLRFAARDYAALASVAVLCGGVVALNIYFGKVL